jgi:hypothetical protein
MGKTYIFFEPDDEGFFEKITNIYGELIKEYYNDAEKAYIKGESHNFYRNYFSALIFPACDYNSKLPCPHTVCCSDKCPVLTEDQKDRITVSLKNVIYRLRTVPDINNVIVDRIYQNSFFLLSTKTEPLLYRCSHTLPFYLQLMRGVSGKTDAENLVYVCSENNNYDYFKDEMLKSNPKALDECVYYR